MLYVIYSTVINERSGLIFLWSHKYIDLVLQISTPIEQIILYDLPEVPILLSHGQASL